MGTYLVAAVLILVAVRFTPARVQHPTLGKFAPAALLLVQAFVLWIVYRLARRRVVLALEPPNANG